MQISYSDLHTQLNEFNLPGIPKFPNQVHPSYDGYSIANLPASLCRWLGCPAPAECFLAYPYHHNLDSEYQHVILLLADGLSLRIFHRFYSEALEMNVDPAWQGILRDGLFLPLTSIAPSTTSAALTTLWSGKTPGEHGIIGYELFLKEFGFIANMITHSVAAFISDPVDMNRAGFNPTNSLPVATLGQHLAPHRIKIFSYQHQSIAHSGLSRMLLGGTQQVAYSSQDEIWDCLHYELQRNQSWKTYSFVYWSGLDTFSHLNGPDCPELYKQWLSFAEGINRLIVRLRADKHPSTLLLLSADHGQISTGIHREYDLRHHPDLTRHLVMMPTGESRLPFLFIKPDAVEKVREYVESRWPNQFTMLTSHQALESGLLGNIRPHQTTLDRFGDHIIIPRGNAYWWWVNKQNHLLGRHGGLSADEMLVPYFVLPI